MKRALYAGSFDPFTNGHLDILKRSSKIFDEVIVAIGTNTTKKSLFSATEKEYLINETVKTEGLDNVRVITYSTELTVQLAEREDARFIIRGLRLVKDFEYEYEIASMNKLQNPEVESVFLLSDDKYRMISSTLVKEIAQFGGEIDQFVPKVIANAVREKL